MVSSCQTYLFRGSTSLQPGDFPHASWYEVTVFFSFALSPHQDWRKTACLSHTSVDNTQKVTNTGLTTSVRHPPTLA